MTYISSIHYPKDDHGKYIDEPTVAEAVKVQLTDGHRKALVDAISSLMEDEFERLREYAEDNLVSIAARRAENFLERVLEGDESAMKALINDSRGTRVREGDGRPWASVINGKIFMTSAMKLRKQIVNAHTDLIRTAYIADMESINEGLHKQIAEMQRRYERQDP